MFSNSFLIYIILFYTENRIYFNFLALITATSSIFLDCIYVISVIAKSLLFRKTLIVSFNRFYYYFSFSIYNYNLVTSFFKSYISSLSLAFSNCIYNSIVFY